MSADYAYPEDGKCTGHPHPELWDLSIEGETVPERHARHEEAKRICATCPVTEQCIRNRDPIRDEGIRGGRLFVLKPSRYGGYGSVHGIIRAPWGSKRAG